jgi:hypothetical protein
MQMSDYLRRRELALDILAKWLSEGGRPQRGANWKSRPSEALMAASHILWPWTPVVGMPVMTGDQRRAIADPIVGNWVYDRDDGAVYVACGKKAWVRATEPMPWAMAEPPPRDRTPLPLP